MEQSPKTQLDRIEEGVASQRNFAHVDAEQMTHIENALYGNGREGLISRTARIEEALAQGTANSVRNSAGIEKLLEKTTELKACVDAHHKTLHLDTLMRKAKFWVTIFAALIGFNLISRYIPSAITLLFQLLGVPGVHLPLE